MVQTWHEHYEEKQENDLTCEIRWCEWITWLQKSEGSIDIMEETDKTIHIGDCLCNWMTYFLFLKESQRKFESNYIKICPTQKL